MGSPINYTPQTWANGGAPALNATNLQTMDNGINSACDRLDALGADASLAAKTSVADADELLARDSADSNYVKKVTWTTAFAAIWTKLGSLIAGGTDKATPLDADTVPLSSAADSAATRKLTWANLKATLKAYNDTLYPALAHATRHQHAGADEIATATPGGNVIPKAGAGGTLAAGFIPQATESAVGGAELATAAEIVTGTDTGRVPNVANLKTALASDGMWLTKRTKMPDGSLDYSKSDFTGGDGWTASANATLTASASGLDVVLGATPGSAMIYRTLSAGAGKYFALRLKRVSGTGTRLMIYADASTLVYDNTSVPYITGSEITLIGVLKANQAITSLRIYPMTDGATGNEVIITGIAIGSSLSYLTGTLSEEAARIADQLGDSAGVGVAASGTITSNGTNVTAGDTVTIAGKVYTFVNSISATRVEGEVLVGLTAADSLDYLITAIRRINPAIYDYNGSSPVYNVAVSHPLVTATRASLIGTITSLTTGELGNSITLAKSAASLTLSGSTLTGGYSDAAAKMSNAVANASQGLTAKTSIAQTDYLLALDSAAGFVKKKVLASNALASTSAYGLAKLASDGGTDAGTAVQGNDSRLATAPATWTPAPKFGNVADDSTITIAENYWTRSGKLTHVEAILTYTAKGSKTGSFTMGGLPVNSRSSSSGIPCGVAAVITGGTSIGGAIIITVVSGVLYFWIQGATGTTALTDANFTNTTALRISVDYIAA